ncbi:MAG: hypothetical protein CBC29_06855 [Methylococcaceae bacterium TMED69]|nr:MAG: hypothetical protein CBC29_06855 [Methylococcaceae bacterium TMED69]|tara:strand:+ start:1915 stop:2505 length:591 start_codon:yes stop_codon:yes gene_type:complete
MQDLIGTWKSFLSEGSFLLTSSELPRKFTGIIQIKPSDNDFLRELQEKIVSIYPGQKPVRNLHVTLLHQSIPKMIYSKSLFDSKGIPLRGDKALKKFFKSEKSKSLFPPFLEFGELGIKSEGEKISTYIKIVNSGDMNKFLSNLYEMTGLDKKDVSAASELEPRESGRIFHISLTNLTGNPGDSIANIRGGKEINL